MGNWDGMKIDDSRLEPCAKEFGARAIAIDGDPSGGDKFTVAVLLNRAWMNGYGEDGVDAVAKFLSIVRKTAYLAGHAAATARDKEA